jgi:hypothetical protein
VLAPGLYQVEVIVPNSSFGTVTQARLVVREANPALTVTPPIIFSTGVNVKIHAPGIGTSPITVTFNGVVSKSVRVISANEVEVPGPTTATTEPYRVVITTDDGRRLESATALFLVSPDAPHDAAFFERVLLPVVYSGSGLLGSQWTTEAVVENARSGPLPLFVLTGDPFFCPIPEGCRILFAATRETAPLRWPWPTGVFVYAARPNSLRFNILIRDLSRQSEALGTEIPVVREGDWKEDGVTLLNVPSDSRFRVALRIYLEDDHLAVGSMAVRVFRMSENTPLIERFVPVGRERGGIPAMGWIGDIGPAFGIAPGEPLRIVIDSPVAGQRFWAFASVTNNDTQHVTVISPQ